MGPTFDPLNRRRTVATHLAACSLGVLFCGFAASRAVAQGPSAGSAVSVFSPSLPESPGFIQAAAESPARITGTIYDVNGGLVPGAAITVLDKAGATIGTATTDSEAHFEVGSLPPGAYRVRIAAEGLETFESPTIALRPGEAYNLPETALPIATANQTVNVVMTQSMIADEEIKEETKQRVLGVLPNFYTSYQWNAAPMNTRQKFKLTFRATTDPVAFGTAAIVAGVEQANNTFPGYGSGWEGYGKRYGAAYGDAFIGRFIGAAVLPSIFHQDPRYFFMGPPSTVGQRFRHAVAFSVTARSDRGHDGHLVPNYSHILGNFIAGYLSKTYHPDSNTALSLATRNALIGIGGSAVQALVREFVLVHISSHTPPYKLGKPIGVDPVEDKPAAPRPAPPPAPDTSTSTPVPKV